MKNWFTVEQLDANTFAISEYQHWEETHCYLLCGTEKALLIDTGLGVANIRTIANRLTSLSVIVVTTHVYWDHIGGHRFFDNIAVHTPGHSPGHCCFYEPKKKYLYSGDLIYRGCLDAFYPTTDPRLFLKSVQKIQSLDIGQVFPAHHQLNIPADLVSKIETGFCELENAGKLIQGAGIFDFGDFQIHI